MMQLVCIAGYFLNVSFKYLHCFTKEQNIDNQCKRIIKYVISETLSLRDQLFVVRERNFSSSKMSNA